MRKILLGLLLVTVAVNASKAKEMIHILKYVETEHNPNIKGDDGRSWGILQIQQIAIDDVNRKYGTDYTHQDAFDISCAEEIFELYTQMWSEHLEKNQGREATEEDIVRIWNGGPRGWNKKSTLKYLKKYRKYKKKHSMNKRKVIVNGNMGVVIATYTYTCDVFMFKSRKTLTGVSRRFMKVIHETPRPLNQYQLEL